MKHLLVSILTIASFACKATNHINDSVASTSHSNDDKPTVTIASQTANQAIRFYGAKPSLGALASKGLKSSFPPQVPILDFSTAPFEQYRPQAVVSGYPLIEPRGMVKGNNFLYISDSGKDAKHNEHATIWRLDPFSKKLDVFYRGPLLTSSKWLWFLHSAGGRPDELIISDFGEEPTFHGQGSGVGAKLFAIAVKPDGTAGATRILYQGPPLRDPQGVTVIGNFVILADTRAGEPAHRNDASGVQFLNGVVFAIPLAGGSPIRLFADQTFVTLVGACTYYDGNTQYLRFWDIDGGRRDTSKFAWMPHSGFSALKKTKVESLDPLRFGPLEDVLFIEEFPISLKLGNLKPNHSIIIRGVDGTTVASGSDTLVLASASVANGIATFVAESPTSKPAVSVELTIFDDQVGSMPSKRFDIPKNDANPLAPARDNKHAGARVNADGSNWLDTTVDGLSRTVSLFPRQGGIMANVWQGAPLVTPMASQPSWDDKLIWLTDLDGGPDGTGAVWQVPLPSSQERALMYSAGNAWKIRARASDR